MQSKESRACEARGYFGVAPAGHADAGLYLHLLAVEIVGKCKLAFISMLVFVYAQIAHKKFCKLSFTRKKFLQVCVYAKIWSNYAPDCRYWSIKLRSNIAR